MSQQPDTQNPEVLVTFYSPPITMRGGLTSQNLGAFKGRLFDADRQLAFLWPSRFVTFHLPSGAHVFSAVSWMNKNANHGAHLTLDLEPDRHYFIEMGTTALGPPFVIPEVPCEKATSDNPHLQSLEVSHLKPAGRSIALNELSFPSCQ